VYEYPNGTVVDFTPDSAAATSSAGNQLTLTGMSTRASATVMPVVAGASTGSASGSTGSSQKNSGEVVAPGMLGVLVVIAAVLF